ncbi:helix-turn-helix domain-containing protein [Mycobacterium hubeiense]|uniref:helix-turn-helix domain-containing protein n=1 Tax=Mycobacterium hubeiense TaxID=1867256 RepID=UPI0018EC3FEE|nr:hypothetical protein [Mycobacterium sp. QGD 101]
MREFRGDAHTAAWTSAGFDAVEIGLLTELYWGVPLKTYIRSRGWSEAELDEGIARLERRGLVADGGLTDHGRAVRADRGQHRRGLPTDRRRPRGRLRECRDAVATVLHGGARRARLPGCGAARSGRGGVALAALVLGDPTLRRR